MACIDCTLWHIAPGSWKPCNPACLECGGRYLWLTQRLQLTEKEKRGRLQAALKAWTDLGHSEQQLRDLAKRNWLKPKG